MSKVVACIIARTVSSRLPLKVLRDLSKGETMLEFLIERLKLVDAIDEIYICTSTEAVDDILVDVAERKGIKVYRGSANQVIERMISVGTIENADIVLRITGDNPLTSVEYIENQISFLREKELDYVRLINVPIGATAEIIKFSALVKCHEIMDPEVSEYMMLFLFEPKNFRCGVITIQSEDHSNMSLTVDTPDDLNHVRFLIQGKKGSDKKVMKLVDLIEAMKVDNKRLVGFDGDTPVKMPYNKTVLFSEFKKDMERRINQSFKLDLE